MVIDISEKIFFL